MIFSTYLGGTGDDVANGVAVDTTGVYVVGSASTNFPLQSPFQGTLNGSSNAFVTKLNTSGSSLAYSTYLGGSSDFAAAVAVNSGNAYVTGATSTPTFPKTAGVVQPACGSDGSCNGGLQDAFVTVFNSSGAALVYSTFLGGEGKDQGLAIALDSSGDAYVTGLTQSSLHFPLKSALQGTFGGGTQDAFVTELNPTGTALVYSTFLGGSADDAGSSIAVDGSKNAYVTGQTNSSTNFPLASATQGTLGGGSDAFVTEISASGSLVFSTYLGGAQSENTNAANPLNPVGAVAVDSAGANIYVAGNTASSPFRPLPALFRQPWVAERMRSWRSTVPAHRPAVFTVSNGALSNTSGHAGVSATATITVGSTGGFNSAVALTCPFHP